MGRTLSPIADAAPSAPESRLDVDVIVEVDDWYALPADPIQVCTAAAEHAFSVVSAGEDDDLFRRRACETSIALTSDARIRDLNRDYRGRDKPTNVLSFASLDSESPATAPPEAPVLLGDIVVAFETVKREAADAGKKTEDHLAHMVVHGMLHLLGFDHVDDDDADVMEALEREAVGRLGIADPYDRPPRNSIGGRER